VAGTYALEDNGRSVPGAGRNYGFLNTSSGIYHSTDSLHRGQVVIHYADTVKGIVSGTFEMKLFGSLKNATITLSDGRFDFKNHQ
jgi:hypothetical protein